MYQITLFYFFFGGGGEGCDGPPKGNFAWPPKMLWAAMLLIFSIPFNSFVLCSLFFSIPLFYSTHLFSFYSISSHISAIPIHAISCYCILLYTVFHSSLYSMHYILLPSILLYFSTLCLFMLTYSNLFCSILTHLNLYFVLFCFIQRMLHSIL